LRSLHGRGYGFFQVFLLSPLQCVVYERKNCKRLREFEEIEISQGKDEEVTVNSKEKNSLDFSSTNSAYTVYPAAKL
jgi:hypothetical protein